jgi:hypothetical protein
MSIIRIDHNKDNPYVMLNKKALEDKNLSWAAKGLWAYLISRPDDWSVSVAHLSTIYDQYGGGETAIYNYLNELIKHGYCEKKGQSQDKKGQFSKFEYVIYEFKIISPLTGSPDADRPDAANLTTTNKGDIKIKEQQQAVVAVSSNKEDQDKIAALKKLPLQHGVIESSMRHSLQDITNAVEHCLSRLDSIRDIDAYFHEALIKKWSSKPTKEKIVKMNEEAEKQQQQDRQKLYMEAKQLELAYNMKFHDDFRFSVTETAITFKIGNGYSPYPLDNDAMKILRQYIKEKLNESL